MNRILISGGAGFIGANLVKLLLEWEPEWKIVVADALTYAGDKKRLEEISSNPPVFFLSSRYHSKRKDERNLGEGKTSGSNPLSC